MPMKSGGPHPRMRASTPASDALVVAFACFDPHGAALALFELPERRPRLQIIHQKFGRGECRLTMARGHADEDDALARCKASDAVHHAHAEKWPASLCFPDMGGDLALGEARIMVERHRLHGVVGAHETDEARDGADLSGRGVERGDLCTGIEVFALDADLAHPPVTGGKKATSSFGPSVASKRACS